MDASDKKIRLIEEGKKISALSEYMDLIKKIGFNEFESGDIFEEEFSNFLFKYHPDFIAIGVKEVYKVKDPSAKKYLDEIGMPSIDIGIDKIIILNNGDIWLNQDKYRSKEILDLSDIATYGMQSFKYKDKIKRSLVISTCKKLSRNLEAEYYGDFEWLLYSELETLISSYENICNRTFFFDFFTFLENKIEPPQKIERWNLRKEQESCKTNCIEELDKKDRVNYCMPPRTGKTLIGFEIQTHLYNKRSLLGLPNIGHMILVPTNDLKTQQADEYLRYQIVRDYPGELGGILIINDRVKQSSRLYFQTNKVSEIFNWIVQMEKSGKKFFIASTYQSIGKIEEVSTFYKKTTGRPLKLGSCFFDESHRLTGVISAESNSKYLRCVKMWTRLLKDTKNLVIEKRIFATATPRDLGEINEKISSHLYENGITQIAGMNNSEVFGERKYILSIADAVNNGLLPTMIIHGINLIDEHLNIEFDNHVSIEVNEETSEKVRIKPTYKAVAFQIAKLFNSGDIKKIIVYANQNSSGDLFKEMLNSYIKNNILKNEISEKIYIESVSGLDGSNKRKSIMNNVESSEYSILINCRVFGEGVTIKSLDSVAFLDPRSSKVDLVQNSQRASNNPHLPVRVILPLRLNYVTQSSSWGYMEADEKFGMLAILLSSIYNGDEDSIDKVLINLRETSVRGKRNRVPIIIEDINDIPESDYALWLKGLKIATLNISERNLFEVSPEIKLIHPIINEHVDFCKKNNYSWKYAYWIIRKELDDYFPIKTVKHKIVENDSYNPDLWGNEIPPMCKVENSVMKFQRKNFYIKDVLIQHISKDLFIKFIKENNIGTRALFNKYTLYKNEQAKEKLLKIGILTTKEADSVYGKDVWLEPNPVERISSILTEDLLEEIYQELSDSGRSKTYPAGKMQKIIGDKNLEGTITQGALSSRLASAGYDIRARHTNKLESRTAELIKKLESGEYTFASLGREIGESTATVINWFNFSIKNGMETTYVYKKRDKSEKKGKHIHKSTLVENQVLDLRSQKKTMSEIASIIGMSTTTVDRIIRGINIKNKTNTETI